MNRHTLTLQRRAGSAFAFVSLSDLALAAFELMPQARSVRVVEETASLIKIRYAWPLGRVPKLLTEEEFDRYGLVCLEKADNDMRLTADSNREVRQTKPTANDDEFAVTPQGDTTNGRQHYVDADQVRAYWAANARFLPHFQALNDRELKMAVALGIEAHLRNRRPLLIQNELKTCYERMVGESISAWEHVLDIAEHVYGHGAPAQTTASGFDGGHPGFSAFVAKGLA